MQSLVRSLGVVYPTLLDWEPDEAVAQRYDESQGLTWHKDLERHPGVIASFSISGTAELHHRMRDGKGDHISLKPRDLVLVRGMDLHGVWYHDLRPEHDVRNVEGDRISLTFRANTRPDDPIDGFQYNN